MKKNFRFLISCWLVVWCSCCSINGQQNKSVDVPPSSANASNGTVIESTAATTPPQNKEPFAGTIKADIPIKDGELSFAERQELRKLLKWNDACNFDLEKKEKAEAGRVWETTLGKDKYVVEVFCDNLGAYTSSSLTYHFDKMSKEATLLNYRYFELDTDKKYKERTTSKPVGFSLDAKKQSISLLNRYYGAGQCGWEANYKLIDGKPILKGMTAQWSCDPGQEYGKWPKQDIFKLKKAASKQ